MSLKPFENASFFADEKSAIISKELHKIKPSSRNNSGDVWATMTLKILYFANVDAIPRIEVHKKKTSK